MVDGRERDGCTEKSESGEGRKGGVKFIVAYFAMLQSSSVSECNSVRYNMATLSSIVVIITSLGHV